MTQSVHVRRTDGEVAVAMVTALSGMLRKFFNQKTFFPRHRLLVFWS